MQKVFAATGMDSRRRDRGGRRTARRRKIRFSPGHKAGGSVMSLELHDITIKIPVRFPLGEVLMSCRGISKRIWRCDGGRGGEGLSRFLAVVGVVCAEW